MPTAFENFTDEELARRALAGMPACYEEIVRRYQVPLLQFLSKRFPSRRDAEDILQDAFLRAWQSLERYDPRFAFRTWLYTIAYRLAVSRGRKQTEEESLPPFESAAGGPSPADAAQVAEQRRNLWDSARRVLTDEQYMALWLHYVDDIPAGEVAKILNRSWVSVKTLMHRARKKLAPFLQDLAHQEPSSPIHVRPALQPVAQAGEP